LKHQVFHREDVPLAILVFKELKRRSAAFFVCPTTRKVIHCVKKSHRLEPRSKLQHSVVLVLTQAIIKYDILLTAS
jgi:hypothetical protein